MTKWCDQVTSDDGCICIPTEYNSNGVSRTKLETRSNARLISAAPELLALLKRYRSETPLGHQPHMIAHEADEAIAKATGGKA